MKRAWGDSNTQPSASKAVEPQSLEGRFWEKVDRSAGPDACWPWKSSRNRKGYGMFAVRRRPTIASRVAYALTAGAWPARAVQVRHRCDNPPCCNPAHLEPGSSADNHQDMITRGRSLVGERNHNCKLTAAQVAEIWRRRHAGERATDLGREFGVDESLVRQIARGDGWSHLDLAQAVAAGRMTHAEALKQTLAQAAEACR